MQMQSCMHGRIPAWRAVVRTVHARSHLWYGGVRPTVLLYCGSIHACIDDSALLVRANNQPIPSFVSTSVFLLQQTSNSQTY